MIEIFCPKHGDRKVNKHDYTRERPTIVLVCEKCLSESQAASQLESDRERAYECDHGGRS